MLTQTRSGAVYGVDARLVDVEVHVSPGGNGDFEIVGLPDTAIREARSRIRAAIRNSSYQVPHHRVVVNLAPATLRKEGSSFDLPMAIGILACTHAMAKNLRDFLLVGELALDGRLRPVRGALSIALLARDLGTRQVIVPAENAPEAALAPGVEVLAFTSLSEVVGFLNGRDEHAPWVRAPSYTACPQPAEDFMDVRGQRLARRAIEVAVAGGHNILMVGPPGSGKTMLARRIPTLIPGMTAEESLETTRIYSAAGLLNEGGLVRNRPFRAPHHSVSAPGLIGGGSIPRPGEVSLAHNGVLFLDELPEFPVRVLEALRQPLEEGTVTVSRARMTLTFPAAFVLAAAMNPCRCGYLGHPARECLCTPRQVHAYRARVSGPLLDRMDIHVEVPAVSFREIDEDRKSESSREIRERIIRAREIQHIRFSSTHVRTNARMRPADLERHCRLDPRSKRLLERAVSLLGVSARGWNRILKVARTIADLGASPDIGEAHIAEAVRYRRLERPGTPGPGGL